MYHGNSGAKLTLYVSNEIAAASGAARVKVVVASVMQPMAEYRFALNVV
jgi:hypothetical protein